jgi:TRAP-type C4-dicarboxylate transport system permease large subunit
MVVHEFVDAAPAILVLLPLIMPAATAIGVSPLQLAAVIAINSSVGAVLPPVGVSLFVASQLAGVDAAKRSDPCCPMSPGRPSCSPSSRSCPGLEHPLGSEVEKA